MHPPSNTETSQLLLKRPAEACNSLQFTSQDANRQQISHSSHRCMKLLDTEPAVGKGTEAYSRGRGEINQ